MVKLDSISILIINKIGKILKEIFRIKSSTVKIMCFFGRGMGFATPTKHLPDAYNFISMMSHTLF